MKCKSLLCVLGVGAVARYKFVALSEGTGVIRARCHKGLIVLTAAAVAVGVAVGALLSPLLTSESLFGVGQAMGLEAAEVVAGGTTPLDAGSGNVAPALRKMSLSTGLYEIWPSKSKRLRLDVARASLASGANVQLYRRNSSNCQKFAVVRVKGGAYRIGAAFSNNALTARSGKKKAHTNVLMKPWRGSSSQLWIPFKSGSGIVFKNKKSGKLLSFKSARSGANVRQAPAGSSSATTLWKVAATKANAGDEASLRNAIDLASGGGLRASNQIAGHKVSAKRWNRLVSAVNGCKSHGISLGFVMVDGVERFHDAGIVDDGHGRRYLLAFSSNANPDSRYRIGRVVKALDAIDHALPKTRAK